MPLFLPLDKYFSLLYILNVLLRSEWFSGRGTISPGRPSKLTEELQTAICSYIEHGNTFKGACTLADISTRIFCKWRAHGEKAKSGKYFLFFHAVKKAEEKYKAWHLQNINAAAAKGNWQASAWSLERKYPDEFGRRERQEIKISGEIKTRDELDLNNLSDDELDELERITAKALNGKAASCN